MSKRVVHSVEEVIEACAKACESRKVSGKDSGLQGLAYNNAVWTAARAIRSLSGTLTLEAPQQEWVSVGERLPEEHQMKVVAFTVKQGDRFVSRAGYYEEREWWFDSDCGRTNYREYGMTVTHWREDTPLPAPPEGGKDKK